MCRLEKKKKIMNEVVNDTFVLSLRRKKKCQKVNETLN